MPTDGTLLLEQLPRAKHYMLTAMSVFFSLGAVLAVFVAILVIPSHSCNPTSSPGCDNDGWRYLLIALALLVRTSPAGHA